LQLSHTSSKCSTTCRHSKNEKKSKVELLHLLHNCNALWSWDWIKISLITTIHAIKFNQR
jgi:hypothetical protein